MKYVITILLSMLTFSASAQQHHHRHHGHHYNNNHYNNNHYNNQWGWVAPALIGGAIVYGISRQTPPPVIYQQPTLPPAPYGYRYEQILDANCNCYRWVLIQG